MGKNNKFKKGAASFYIVSISTLLLVIIATSFIAIIISEITRTSDNDLAQSAYDSALAGVEDAKLAYYNYQECKNNNFSGDNCLKMEDNFGEKLDKTNCTMTGKIIGRLGYEEDADNVEVMIKETKDGDNNMQQAYTCVKFKDVLNDYEYTLTNNETKVIALGDAINAGEVKSIRVSWQVDEGKGSGYVDLDEKGIFGDKHLLPPVLAVGLVQTSKSFNMNDFDKTKTETEDGKTDRGMLYLVPSKDRVSEEDPDKYKVADKVDGDNNAIDEKGFLKSNDKTAKNLPYIVDCSSSRYKGYMCSTKIKLPDPIGGNRINNTFAIIVSTPFSGNGSTEVSIEYYNENSSVAEWTGGTNLEGSSGLTPDTDGEPDKDSSSTTRPMPMSITGAQVEVDSTGRANDLYRRVVTRLEIGYDGAGGSSKTTSNGNAIELFGNGSNNEGSLINKNLTPTCEYDFDPTCSR